MTTFVPLGVNARRRETPSTVSWELEVPEPHRDSFRWIAGQHLIVRCTVEGQSLRRCYSISSPPGEALRLTVRQIRDGRVSTYLHESLSEGDKIEALPPTGKFCLETSAQAYRSHYFFAAGSGITPIYSMIQAVLRDEPHSTAYLLFGHRNRQEAIFGPALEQAREANRNRLHLVHALSSPPLWNSAREWRGRISASSVTRFLDQHRPIAQDAQYWICGPGNMNEVVRDALMAVDVPSDRIHSESFGNPTGSKASVTTREAELSVKIDGEPVRTLRVEAGQTILEALRKAEISTPFSCTAGVCGTCRAHLENGKVHMRTTAALDDAEIAAGHILTCQSRPTSDRLVVRLDPQR